MSRDTLAQQAAQPAQQAGDERAATLRNEGYDVVCDRRDLFDMMRAAWRDGQTSGGDIDDRERWDRATTHATQAIQGWATLRHVPHDSPSAAATQPAQQPLAVLAGEVVMTASYSTYVRWAAGVTPPSGTKLYSEPQTAMLAAAPAHAPTVQTLSTAWKAHSDEHGNGLGTNAYCHFAAGFAAQAPTVPEGAMSDKKNIRELVALAAENHIRFPLNRNLIEFTRAIERRLLATVEGK